MKGTACRHNCPNLVFFVIVLLSIFFGGKPCPLMAAEVIRIGEIDPLSGHLAKHGTEIHQGIVMAVEEANARGGVAGHLAQLISRDDQSKPEVALKQAQDLIIREKVLGLLGGYVDSLVGPVSELAARHQVPYVASASLQRGLTAKGIPIFSGFPGWMALLSRYADLWRTPSRPKPQACCICPHLGPPNLPTA